jgi:hypothetical protein
VKRIEEDGIVIEEGGVDVRIAMAIKFPEHWVRPGTLSLGTPES